MRRIVTTMWITMDGLVDGDGGAEINWLRGDSQLMRYEISLVEGADTLLLGRKTFNDFASYWPRMARGTVPEADRLPMPEVLQRAYGRRLDAMDKVVVSASGNAADWQHSRAMRSLDQHDVLALKQETGGDIVVYGSLSLVNELAGQGLIDEYQLLVHPIYLGKGTPLFSSGAVGLRLVAVEPFESGVVLMTYRPE